MKKIVTILFVLQMFIISFYGVLFFAGDAFHHIISDNQTEISIRFGEDENFHRFLDLLADKEIEASRIIFRGDTDLSIYTTDFTMDGLVQVQAGRFPLMGTTEFVSNINTGEIDQVGIIHDVMPGFRLVISAMDNLTFTRDSTYYLRMTNEAEVRELILVLESFLPYVNLRTISNSSVHPLVRLAHGSGHFGTEVFELLGISFIIFFSMISSIIQLGVTQLKSVSLKRINGYGNIKLFKMIMLNYLKPLLLGFVISYLLTVLQSTLRGFGYFMTEISIYFGVIGLSLIVCYLLIGFVGMSIYLSTVGSTQIVKGKKKVGFIQFGNHLLKACFVLLFLFTFIYAAVNLFHLRQRMQFTDEWERTQNIYQLPIWFGIDGEIEELLQFYDYLSKNHNGFFLDADFIRLADSNDPWNRELQSDWPEVDPRGYRFTISPNFLNINPITASNGIDVQEQIIWERHVLNLLVPEHLRSYEAEIIQNYVRDATGVKGLAFEEIVPNLIYVESGQYYQSMDISIRPEVGGFVLDPIAVLYTGNITPREFVSWVSVGLHFQSDAIDPYREILPMIDHYNLSGIFRIARPVYNEFSMQMSVLQGIVTRLTGLIGLLVAGSLMVTYHLVANYFEANKFELTIKRHHGYHELKRHKSFIIAYLSYTIPAILFISYIMAGVDYWGFGLGWYTFAVGIIMLVIDLIVAAIFERRLMKKSFAEIMKGER